MSFPTGPEALLVGFTLGVAGLMKGLAGLGFSLVATPVLTMFFGPRTAIAIGSIPGLVLNFLLLLEGRRWFSVSRELWSFAAIGAAGVILGLLLLIRMDANGLRLAIAALTLASLAAGGRLKAMGNVASRNLGLAIAGFSGVLSGSTSIDGPLLAAYFHARLFEPGKFIVTVTTMFQVYSAVQVIGFWRLGLYGDTTVLAIGFLGLLPTVALFLIGQRIRQRIPVAAFRRVVTSLLVVASLNLMLQALSASGPPWLRCTVTTRC